MIMRLLMLLAVVLLSVSCDAWDCKNRLFQTVPSPDSKLKVVVYQRTCGATTGFNRQLAVLRSNQAFPSKARLDYFFDIAGEPKIQVIWKSNTDLLIRHESSGKIYTASPTNGSIAIKYEQYTLPANSNATNN